MTLTPDDLEELALADEQRQANTPFWRLVRVVEIVLVAVWLLMVVQ